MDLRSRKVLVVDDNETNLLVMQEILEEHYELKFARGGEEALKLAFEDPPDLVLLDIMMPGIDGFETCRRMRETPLLRATKIILVSARAMVSERLAGYEAGADDYVTKPFEPEELLAKVRVFMRLTIAETENGELAHLNGMLEREVHARRRLEDRLRHKAMHDDLTNIPNRYLLLDRVGRCIERSKRSADYLFAVLFVDLDHFKDINDSLGHAAGDALLVEISRRLQGCLRSLDSCIRPGDDTTARIGGDEFVILLDGLRDEGAALQVADRVLSSLGKPMVLEDQEVACSGSVGVATSRGGYTDGAEILRDADTALYQAKEAGKNQAVLFEESMRDAATHRLQLRSDLGRAVENHQLALQYQPIVSLRTGEIVKFEALVRMYHPNRSLIPPDEFIPLAEEMGLIGKIGEWVMNEACRQMVRWKERCSGGAGLSVSVNLSGRELKNPGFLARVERCLRDHRLDVADLNLELTESIVIRDVEGSLAILRQLAERGIGLHMDDFGTGYSSLSMLNRLPFSVIKLDRSFVTSIIENESHRETVRAVCALCHTQGKEVVAEGVETQDQLELLSEMGCDMAQGYFLAKPLDFEDSERLLDNGGHWLKAIVRPEPVEPAGSA